MRNFPNDTLPTEQLDLQQFTTLMYHASERGPVQYIDTALCGRIFTDDVPHRVSLNARQGLSHPISPQFTRDFDSAIGITRTLPYTSPFNVYPISNFRDTLTKPNHVQGPIYLPDVSPSFFYSPPPFLTAPSSWPPVQGKTIYVPLSKIPNCALGTVGSRHLTRVFFPKLYLDKAEPALRQDQLETLYDHCIRPAVMRVIPSQASHWPVNYHSALNQARDTTGHLHFSSMALPPTSLVDFCDALLARLRAFPGFEMAYFGHELRGLKGGTAHEDEGRHPERAFNTFFEHIDPALLDESDWLVDVGLEIYDPGNVVQWSRHSHSAILSYLLPSLTDDELQSLQRRKTFHLDNVSQLDDFAGFRSEPGRFGQRHDITYINVYTTDKCPTYQLHTGIWRRRRCKDLFPKKLEKLVEDLQTMSTTYKSCAGTQEQPAQEGCARLEIRVSLDRARDALRHPPRDAIARWTYSVSPALWWHFKFYRMGAIYAAFLLLEKTPTPYRPMRSSLTLGAILIYMMNAINYRPAEGQAETELTRACCWNLYPEHLGSDLVESDEDEDPMPVMLGNGIYFISGITLQQGLALRMGGGVAISMDSITRLYGVTDEQDVKLRFNVKTWHGNPKERCRNRIQNRRKAPVDIRHIVDDDDLKAQQNVLAERGITMMPIPQEAGPDITDPEVYQMDEDRDGQEGIDDIVARMWRQFPYDLFENAPNPRSNREASHLLMTQQEREEATLDVFKNTDLRRMFSRVVVKVVNAKDWHDLQFRRFFPRKGFVPPTRFQNFPYMRYFQEWNTLMERLTKKDADVVRGVMWKEFKTFQWLPLTDTDRAWNTKKVTGPQWTHLPFDDKKPVVRIALNEVLVQDPNRVRIYSAPNSDEEGSDSDIEIVDFIE